MSAEDIRTLEECADELMRAGSAGHAVRLWALALKVRAGSWEDYDNGGPGTTDAEWVAERDAEEMRHTL